MVSAEGCQRRRQRLWERLDPKPDNDHLRLSDPIHLMYLAGFSVDPFSLGSGYDGYLLLRNDAHATVIYDSRLPASVQQAQVDERRVVKWYDGQSPPRCPRRLAPLEGVNPQGTGLRIHDRVGDPYAAVVIDTIARMRRQK